MSKDNGWIDVPWWFAWLVWTVFLAWPILPAAIIFEAVFHTGDTIGALSWLVSSLIAGLTSTIVSRFLHSSRESRVRDQQVCDGRRPR